MLYFACGKNPSGPKDDFKDPRQYTWSVDTLAYPSYYSGQMDDIWGSSTRDVYVVGHGSGASRNMFHFDGNQWTPVNLAFGASVLVAIYGFASNDIWAVGSRFESNPNPPPGSIDSSLLIHYDGTTWKEFKLNGGRFLLDVWGQASNDVWTGGGTDRFLVLMGLAGKEIQLRFCFHEMAFSTCMTLLAVRRQMCTC